MTLNWPLSFAFFFFFGLRNTSFLVKNYMIDIFYMFVLEKPVDNNSKMILPTKIPEHLLMVLSFKSKPNMFN